jgi:hypothetical protein
MLSVDVVRGLIAAKRKLLHFIPFAFENEIDFQIINDYSFQLLRQFLGITKCSVPVTQISLMQLIHDCQVYSASNRLIGYGSQHQ